MEIKIVITYDSELEQVHIENGYDSCSYMNIKNVNEIASCVVDYIQSYEEE